MTNPYIFMLVRLTLAFAQGHMITRKLIVVESVCCRVT